MAELILGPSTKSNIAVVEGHLDLADDNVKCREARLMNACAFYFHWRSIYNT